jgi:hypothetical protein
VHLDDCRADNTGQQQAKNAEAENQSPSDVQIEECHGEIPPMQAADGPAPPLRCSLTMKIGTIAGR